MLHFSKGGNYMYQFPKDLYADIRLEDVYQTAIVYENHNLIQNKTSRETGAFLRIWDGRRWEKLTKLLPSWHWLSSTNGRMA